MAERRRARKPVEPKSTVEAASTTPASGSGITWPPTTAPVLYPVDASEPPSIVKPAGKYLTLPEYYGLLGCQYIERVHVSRATILVVDEEGLCPPGRPVNQHVLALCGKELRGPIIAMPSRLFK